MRITTLPKLIRYSVLLTVIFCCKLTFSQKNNRTSKIDRISSIEIPQTSVKDRYSVLETSFEIINTTSNAISINHALLDLIESNQAPHSNVTIEIYAGVSVLIYAKNPSGNNPVNQNLVKD